MADVRHWPGGDRHCRPGDLEADAERGVGRRPGPHRGRRAGGSDRRRERAAAARRRRRGRPRNGGRPARRRCRGGRPRGALNMGERRVARNRADCGGVVSRRPGAGGGGRRLALHADPADPLLRQGGLGAVRQRLRPAGVPPRRPRGAVGLAHRSATDRRDHRRPGDTGTGLHHGDVHRLPPGGLGRRSAGDGGDLRTRLRLCCNHAAAHPADARVAAPERPARRGRRGVARPDGGSRLGAGAVGRG